MTGRIMPITTAGSYCVRPTAGLMDRDTRRTAQRGACYYVWRVTMDVASELIDEGGEVAVLYHSGSGTTWWEAEAEEVVEGALPGYECFLVRVFEHTVGPGMSMTSLMRTHISLIPVVTMPAGGRIFDHNRNPGDFDNYELVADNEWAIGDDPAVCAASSEHLATLEFLAGWTEGRHGAIVAGGGMRVWYDPARLPDCRASYTFAPAWDIEVQGRFWSGGQEFSGSVVAFEVDEYGRRHDVPHPGTLDVDVPEDATSVELWFWNWSAMSSPCEAWDSRFGENYSFDVIPASDVPVTVLWAGDWGNGFWRGCTHRSGLEEPMTIDSYLMQQACLDVYADVYVPGLTDGSPERPEWLQAQVEFSVDSAEPRTAWLTFVGQVDNNYRYRWTLPREEMNRGSWSEYRYSFRFSTDGTTWYRIGVGDGPDGGEGRTLLRGW